MHKEHCQRPAYLLKFQVNPREITDPPVWRTLYVPSDTTFRKLHAALQVAFSWSGTHSYEFHVHDDNAKLQNVDLMSIIKQRMKMDAAQFEPGEYQGDPDSQREFVHRITDDRDWTREACRPPIDRMHEPKWAHPLTTKKGSSRTKLWEVLENAKLNGLKMTYLYDYGDCWEHDFEVVGRQPAGGKIECIDGKNNQGAFCPSCVSILMPPLTF